MTHTNGPIVTRSAFRTTARVLLALLTVVAVASGGALTAADPGPPPETADGSDRLAEARPAGSAAATGRTVGADETAPAFGSVAAWTPGTTVSWSAEHGNDSAFDDDAAATLTDGRTYYVGQTLKREAGVAADEQLDLRRSGQLDGPVFADSDGVVRIDTSGLAVGTYDLSHQNGTEVASFRLVRQTIDARLESESVSNGGTDTEATLSLQSNRRSVVHYLTATVDGERIDAATLRRLFGGRGTTLDDETLRIEGTNAESYSLNVSDVPAGTFRLTTTVPDTGATASASIRVEDSRPGSASFTPRVVQGTAGDVVTIGIAVEGTDNASLVVGSTDLDYRVTMDLVDGDGDGEVVVRWDTSRAGAVDATAAFGVVDSDDAVTDVSRSTGPLPGTLAAEPYPLAVRVGGTETDVGTVSLQEPETVQVCGRDGSTLVEPYHDNVDRIPSWVEGIVTDETIHLVVNGERGGDYTAVTDSEARVSTFHEGVPGNATVAVETDCETITTVRDARRPADAFAAAYDDGEITVSGRTLWKTVAVEVTELVLGIGRSLGLF